MEIGGRHLETKVFRPSFPPVIWNDLKEMVGPFP